MITPIITSITRDVFDTTPQGQKEAALALGATRWEMIRGTALSAQIFSNAQTGFPNAIDRAWGAALTLIVLVLLLSTVARAIAARFTVR